MMHYHVTVRVGFYEFVRVFDDEEMALKCFDSIASTTDTEVEGSIHTSPSSATVDDITIRQVLVDPRIGDPTRK
jgi:hypothetical protein